MQAAFLNQRGKLQRFSTHRWIGTRGIGESSEAEAGMVVSITHGQGLPATQLQAKLPPQLPP